MEKIKISIQVTDAESPTRNILDIDWQEATQGNLNVIATKLKEISPVIQGLTDNDTVTGSVEITDVENPEINAMVAVNNVSKTRATTFVAMVQSAFQSNETFAASTPGPVADATTETVNAKESDEQQ